MDVMLRLDYATFNFAAGTMDQFVLDRCLLGGESLGWRSRGLSQSDNILYAPVCGLRYMHNSGYSVRPHRLDVSGVGCEKFGPLLPILRRDFDCHFSRLDFAFDIFVKKEDWRSFICRSFESSFSDDRKNRKITVAGSGEAMTVYVGVRRADKYCRIYNKSLEDPSYNLIDTNGNILYCPDDSYVIRYELELKRQSRKDRVFDPSPLFDSYFGDFSEVAGFVKSTWKTYGNDVLLPDGFDNFNFVNYTTYKFCSKEGGADCDLVTKVQNELHEAPRSFEKTLRYLVSRFGKYIPYIALDQSYFEMCLTATRREYGFAPVVQVVRFDGGALDSLQRDEFLLEDFDEHSLPTPPEWDQIEIDNLLESEV